VQPRAAQQVFSLLFIQNYCTFMPMDFKPTDRGSRIEVAARRWWLKRHAQGLVEYLWKKPVPLRRSAAPVA
jgi:hypothetical protein